MVENNEQVKSGWGGARAGAGRKVGSTDSKPRTRTSSGNVRKQKQVRVFDDEWEIIKAFSEIVKYGDRAKAEKFVEENKVVK